MLGLAPEFEAHWRKIGEAVKLGGITLAEFQAAITDLQQKHAACAALQRDVSLAAAQRDTARDTVVRMMVAYGYSVRGLLGPNAEETKSRPRVPRERRPKPGSKPPTATL
ncbi:MAG: hypothetical protein COZ06_31255 [Armatimonadetes bacterium CG_4_10_14_3_um_filter_66_18]|nr:hypothetical protein [Armatimonadota bacterium]OIP05974.1 MAG: hypothetical protein AUJ96_09785 [Armatimonadetes bacterium CG2_30_66_41]PIU95787.1 MAG: hypothetical protein COS65_00655 [Armatimonadetes bacterium CG06_land_8_20_14_3_00_66_21]PIX37005.1 MAG: hypothetical protein COZ57_36560 [Armatimonadetes bacterium CG_4_8_14_3_um_filter_66_20]PIY38431.1 MAG: hypothetical protein COZ06_31255 [Armatimonadetes bacterium CG_4_10_14_3_um_filter_66_18]PIZ45846.1 MAG: hypothetical protein COY42_11